MIETTIEGLRLSPIEATDAHAIYAILGESGVGEQVNPNWSLASLANFPALIGWGLPQSLTWTILDGNSIIGVYVLSEVDWRNHSVRALTHAMSRSCEGKGYGVAISIAMRDWATAQGLTRTWFTTTYDLAKTQKRVEPLGFLHEGTERRAFYVNGRWLDQHRFAYIAGE